MSKEKQRLPTLDKPEKRLGISDIVALIVGIVVGAGIFRTPSLVAANTSGDTAFYLTWLLGGVISLIGALSYAELTSAYPNTGGDYHFLYRAYGKRLAFLFAWARMSVIQTGSIALLAFIFGDYAVQIYPIGPHGEVIYAAAVIIILTAINMAGLKMGSNTQKLFTVLEILGIVIVIGAGLFFAPNATATIPATDAGTNYSFGMAMVFVLLTFGGWNEAAYISAEIKSGPRSMVKAMVLSIIIITTIYLIINYTYIRVLGHSGVASSEAVAADLMRIVWGEQAVKFIGILVAVSALTSANATIITGARSNYALGRDLPLLSSLGKWNKKNSSPINALLIQAIIAILLVCLGLFTRDGFEAIVDYTAPVFWFFFLLIGIAVIVLRVKDPHSPRPFKVPLYPVLPIIFCVSSALLLYSSLTYTGKGALFGVGIILLGLLLPLFSRRSLRQNS
ncbi:APC family permease [Olivibacter sitiensis]|uniref:APC family permease n=1 Tax=Olivibacter sitiensis TaxID=376470 RepID=UPI00041B08A3|nr:amino acid permease [Olivibacter sitiensis]